jgi:hypothetical protein
MSSLTRRRFPLYQAQRRTQIDTLFYSLLYWFSISFWQLAPTFKL